MKKHLLLTVCALFGVSLASYSYDGGDYVYAHSGKYQIVSGENLLVNGDFSNGLEGWTSLAGKNEATLGDTLKVYSEGGPDGGPYMQVAMAAGSAMGTNLINSANFRQSVYLPGGQYVFTYKVRSQAGAKTSNARSGGRNDDYQDVYINSDGTCPYPNETEKNKIRASVAEWVDTKAGEWLTVNYYYRSDTAAYVNFEFFNIPLHESFADFGVYEVIQVADDRYVSDVISFLTDLREEVASIPELSGKVDNGPIDDAISELNGMLDDPESMGSPEDLASALDGLVYGEGSALSGYLDAFSADVSKYFSSNYFDYNDVATKDAGDGSADDWTDEGGNWGVSAPWSNLSTNHIFAEVGANKDLAAGSEYITASLPAGKYLYMVSGSAIQYYGNGSGKTSNYEIPDYYNQQAKLGYFVNGDTATMDGVSTWMAKNYFHVFDVAEGGEQTVGFWHGAVPKFTGNDRLNKVSGGGVVRFDNVGIRILGVTDEEVEDFYLASRFDASRDALGEMIDSANVLLSSDRYIFGKSILSDSVAISQQVYGKYVEATLENLAVIDAQMPYMSKAISNYCALNAEYVKLGDDINAAKELLANEKLPNGRDAFSAAIDDAAGYYGSLNSSSERDSVRLVEEDAALLAAMDAFTDANVEYGITLTSLLMWENMSSASYDNSGVKNMLEGNVDTEAEGFSMAITGNLSKTYSGAEKITIDYKGEKKTLKTIKCSNGAQNTIILPEGAKVTKLTLWSYTNLEAPNRPNYWAEVGGTKFTEETATILTCYKDFDNPDHVSFSLPNVEDVLTFTNTGEQQCVIVEMEYHYGEGSGTDGIDNVATQEVPVSVEYYNLAGARISAPGTGVYIMKATMPSGKVVTRKVLK